MMQRVNWRALMLELRAQLPNHPDLELALGQDIQREPFVEVSEHGKVLFRVRWRGQEPREIAEAVLSVLDPPKPGPEDPEGQEVAEL